MKIKSIALTADTPTINGNIYPKSVLENIVKHLNEQIKDGRALGVMDMPTSSTINLTDVSHKVTDAHMEGDNLIVEVELIEGPTQYPSKGREARMLKESGVELVIRPAGIGNLDKNNIVQDDYELISMNLVNIKDAS
jgi:hypothetical protein